MQENLETNREKALKKRDLEIEAFILPEDVPPTLIPAQAMSARELLRLMRENPKFKFVFPDEPGGDNYDPTPWCHLCGAKTYTHCHCGPYADNH